MTTTELTYPERATAMEKRARKALVEKAGALWLKAKHAAANIGELEVLAINRMREAGLALNAASGHEQLIFSLEGAEFCRKEILPHLPEGMDLRAVRVCVHLAANLKAPIASREELKAAKAHVQLVLDALGLADASRRKELQSAHTINLFCKSTRHCSQLLDLLDELEKAEPMETWPANKLDEFLDQSAPLKERIAKAEKLRLAAK